MTYGTGELKGWSSGPGELQHTSRGKLNPASPWVIDVFNFTARNAGLYEMNICARILGCDGDPAPPFSGFARSITKIDPSIFVFEPNTVYDSGMRFQVYE